MTLEESRMWFRKLEAYLEWNWKVLTSRPVEVWRQLLEIHLDADLAAMLSSDDRITDTTQVKYNGKPGR